MTNQTIATKHEDIERATYSPEDNKLRIYPLNRLDKDLYDELKTQGFGWAPKQELFVKPSWSPEAEDLCIRLAGTIEPEDTTMAERAEAKAERLKALAEKRADEARGFSAAANNMSFGDQPILLGHHSQRKMEKTQKAQERNEERAKEASSAVRYWNWKMMGTVAHANHKNRPDVIERRIKTLLTDLRKKQRELHAAGDCLSLWERCKGFEDAERQRAFAFKIANFRWDICVPDTLDHIRDESKPLAEIIDDNIALGQKRKNDPKLHRKINHILNRLTYERAQLGEVDYYTGKVTGPVLQTFLRTHGADKPKATKSDFGWIVECENDLPIHIGTGSTLEMDTKDWRDLMYNVGYEVPAPKPKAPPILNLSPEEATSIEVRIWGSDHKMPVVSMTKAEYMAIYSDERGCKPSTCGQFRAKVCRIVPEGADYWKGEWVAVYLTDAKRHALPDSTAIEYVSKEVENA